MFHAIPHFIYIWKILNRFLVQLVDGHFVPEQEITTEMVYAGQIAVDPMGKPIINERPTTFVNRANSIKEYYEERKAEYRLMELDELTARRRRYINERIKHYNDNQ